MRSTQADTASIKIKQRNPVVNEGNKIRLTAIDGQGSPLSGVRWVSGSPEIAQVDSLTGEVQGLERGFATITAVDGSMTASVFVVVARIDQGKGENVPGDVKTDLNGQLYLSNPQQNVIMKASQALSASAKVFAGTKGIRGFRNGTSDQSLFAGPTAIGIDNRAKGGVYIADTLNHSIRRIGYNNQVETILGNGAPGKSAFDENLEARFEAVKLNGPRGTATDLGGNLFISDSDNHAIYYADFKQHRLQLLAGNPGEKGTSDGIGREARFSRPAGLSLDRSGQVLAVADQDNGRVRFLSLSRTDTGRLTCQVSTVGVAPHNRQALNSSPAQNDRFRFDQPASVSFGFGQNLTVVDDTGAYIITPVQANQLEVVELAQAGTFHQPTSVTVDGAKTYVLDAPATDPEAALKQVTFGAPEISSLSAETVRMDSQEEIIITGKNFAPESLVVVGDQVIRNTTVDSATQIRFRMPKVSLPGGLTVSVQTRGGLAQRRLTVLPQPLSELRDGEITTVAGGIPYLGDGQLAANAIVYPGGLTLDSKGNLFIVEPVFNTARIRRIDAQTGVINTVAGNGGYQSTQDNVPAISTGVGAIRAVVDSTGSLIVADHLNSRVRRIDAQTNIITTIALNGNRTFSGDGGKATSAGGEVFGLGIDDQDNLYLADQTRVRRVDAKTGIIQTIAGTGIRGNKGDDGPALKAQLEIQDLLVDPSGNVLIAGLSAVRRVDARTGIISRIAGREGNQASNLGDGGPATQASVAPYSLAFDSNQNLFISELWNRRVRRVDNQTGIITTVAGNGKEIFFNEFPENNGEGGPAVDAYVFPVSITLDGEDNIFIADTFFGIRKVDGQTGVITTLVPKKVDPFTGQNQVAIGAPFFNTYDLNVTDSGDLMISADGRILGVDSQTSIIKPIAGNGDVKRFIGQDVPALSVPIGALGIESDVDGNVYFSDSYNGLIRKVNAQTGILTTVAGNAGYTVDPSPGPATERAIFGGDSIKVRDGKVFIANLCMVQVIDLASNQIKTLANLGIPEGKIELFHYLALDSKGNIFATADDDSPCANRIFKINPQTGQMTVFVERTNPAFGLGDNPIDSSDEGCVGFTGLAIDGADTIFVGVGNRVFKMDKTGQNITPIVGTGKAGPRGDGGPALQASFGLVTSLEIDTHGNLFILDKNHNAIRVVKGVAVPHSQGGGDPSTKVTVNKVSFTKPMLTIEGTGFGSATAQVRINGSDMSSRMSQLNNQTITLTGSAKKLNLRNGMNEITVTVAGQTSAPYAFSYSR
ncbi:MAG: IPT/TIG domain-containing protein [Acidobacteria bacterium]|nr:IPT/TIG domain-containing protein [Acidobacteriota bacterium]